MTRTAEVIEQEAAAWVVRRDREDYDPLSAEEQARLNSWLAISRHAASYVRMEVAWHRADILKRLRPIDGRVDADLLRRGMP